MEKMLDGIKLVKVLCVEPNGVWAMVRVAGYPHSMPYVVRVKELSQPTPRAADVAPGCPSCHHLVGEGHAADCSLAHPQRR
jgi:hypothetical protein